jgi:hypothetical protein
MSCSTALAIRPVSAPIGRFGLRTDLAALDQVLGALDHGHAGDRDLTAALYEALGWQVLRAEISRRRITWRTRSPLSTAWLPMPDPLADTTDAATLVPHGWDYSAGVVDGHPRAWCRERRIRPGHDLPRFAECNRLTVARALTAAALHAHRQIAMEAAHA